MDFNSYQEFTKSLAVYNTDIEMRATYLNDPLAADKTAANPGRFWMPYTYPAFAIAEEAGEVCGKIAKFVRKSNKGVTTEQVTQLRLDIGKELGDLLFQVSETARMFGWTLEEIAQMNVDKLTDRQERGVLVGDGDNR